MLASVRRFRLPIGRILGIRLYLHASWFLVLGLVVWVSARVFAQAYPELPGGERGAMALITGLAFFAGLALHEVSHAVVARRFGIVVRGITLFVFGGVAEIEGEVPTPGHEFAVALVGPATSITLAAFLALLAMGASGLDRAGAEGVLYTLAAVNLGVALFNLIPGLPLDGGRLLRAGIWRWTGDFARATRIAALGGRPWRARSRRSGSWWRSWGISKGSGTSRWARSSGSWLAARPMHGFPVRWVR